MDNFTCARCKQDFNESDEVVYCPVCETYHHQECWDKAGGCANPKCEEYVPSKFTPKPAKSTKNTSQKRNVARAHSSESIDENIEKLYTLRAGISMISMEYDRANSEDEALKRKYKDTSSETKNDSEIERLKNSVDSFESKLKKLKIDESTYEKRAKRQRNLNITINLTKLLLFILNIVAFLVCLVFCGLYLFTSDYDAIGSYILYVAFGLLFTLGMTGALCFMDDGFHITDEYFSKYGSYYKSGSYDIECYKRDSQELAKLLDDKSLVTRNNHYAEKNNQEINNLRRNNALASEKYGSAMFEALRKQFAEFLSPADWENIDLLIFYFETGRALTLREALQLVDKQRQADMIVEAIESATQRICTTINHGMLNLHNTIIGCASVLSAQLSSIQTQQDQILSNQIQLQIEASTLQSALKSKSNTSSKQLMEDVHQLRVYADNLEVKRRNS